MRSKISRQMLPVKRVSGNDDDDDDDDFFSKGVWHGV